eukprot:649934-Rhodomonas_salina.2
MLGSRIEPAASCRRQGDDEACGGKRTGRGLQRGGQVAEALAACRIASSAARQGMEWCNTVSFGPRQRCRLGPSTNVGTVVPWLLFWSPYRTRQMAAGT